jgi:type I restriction enzyme S subunit
MSKIDELIERYCPDGVEFREIGEIADIDRGGSFQKKDFADQGFPCIHYGQIYTHFGIYADKTISCISPEKAAKSKLANPGDVVMAVTSENVEDVCKSVAWLGREKIAVSGHTAIIRHTQNPKFLSYYFSSSAFFQEKKKLAHGTKVIEVTPNALLHVKIPVPPMPVQDEIVRVLDSFAELEAELESELEARNKQYAYYRNQILSFSERSVHWMAVKDVCKSICSGGTPSKSHAEYYDGGDIPWLRTQDISFNDIWQTSAFISGEGIANSSAKWIPENCVVVAMYGATVGKVAINKIPLTTNQACCNLQPNETVIDYRFLFHCLSNKYEYIKSLGQGSQTNISAKTVKSLIVPVPSLAVQHRIVEQLDAFYAITTDLTSGLPAEIEARRKQYAYYRDKLLTFKEKA